MTASLRLRRWSEDEFASARELWNGVLAASQADPLFMSWDWQWRWWVQHRELLQADLVLFGMYTPNDELVGIVPLYAQRVRHKGCLRARRLQIIGSAWRDDRPAFSEYLDVIAMRQYADAILDTLHGWFASDQSWDELLLSHVLTGSVAARLAEGRLGRFTFVRRVDPLVAHRIALPRRFDDYVARLASGTRRRLYNQRSKVRLELTMAGPQEIEDELDKLRSWKANRWEQRATHAQAFRSFHLEFAAAMARLGRLRLSRLMIDGRAASLLYNVRVGATEYYLESAFDPEVAAGLTPGYLHFGYAIEQCCRDGLDYFDLLGGEGRHRAYKRDLCTEERGMFCYQILRAPLLRTVYAAHHALVRIVNRRRSGEQAEVLHEFVDAVLGSPAGSLRNTRFRLARRPKRYLQCESSC